MSLARNFLLWASTNPTLSQNLPRMTFVRRAVRRFMPGEKLEDALKAAEQLKAQGIPTIVTRLGENLEALSEATEVRDHYLRVYDEIAARDLDCWVSVKPTQLGLDLDPDHTAECMEVLAEKAGERGSMLWIDMEASEYVDITIELFRTLRARHDNVGLCLQSYLYRTPDDLEELLELNSAIRLVKGAYAEPADIAFPEKAEVDQAFYDQALQLLDLSRRGGAVPGMGTHDEPLIEKIELAARNGATPASYEIQMLYGIATAAQLRWVREGRRVRVLISYGDAWYPWYMRRLAERPANVGFVIRSMFR
jgi:proline dehydrogenase